MTGDGSADARIDALSTLLVQTGAAHGVFEEAELQGVYNKDWPAWYAAYAVDHGIAELVGHAITIDELAAFLASINVEFEQTEPKSTASWAAYTARRIAAEL